MTQQYNQRPFIYRSREDIDAFLETKADGANRREIDEE